MTEILVADYAFDRPDLTQFKAAGFVGIARYIAPLPNGKVFGTNPSSEQYDGEELRIIRELGMSLVLVWETVADRALAGFAAGASDATRANEYADKIGFPLDCPIYYAIDTDTHYLACKLYFDGCRSVGKRPVGCYGSYNVCLEAQKDGIPFLWQTVAWSNGQLLQSAHLYQRNYHSVELPGNWDENVVLQPNYGQWETAASMPTPTVPPTMKEARSMDIHLAGPNADDWLWLGSSQIMARIPVIGVYDVLKAANVPSIAVDADTLTVFQNWAKNAAFTG